MATTQQSSKVPTQKSDTGTPSTETKNESQNEPKKVAVYNPNLGLTGKRVGGPYLDELELKAAEVRRAEVEGREPDFNNMAGSAGVPLLNSEQMAALLGGGDMEVARMIDAHENDPNLGPNPLTYVDAVGNPEYDKDVSSGNKV